ncbi:unnamed protein product [Danaus chrysippus]|uniref:(African queen) hypothetical protein n=1 Tax=Danaus chrysippus TaxID=151541 RepID=A0A8J2WAJ2_9NEOP|nr:unnamed protein product [Danaus chrysippus]
MSLIQLPRVTSHWNTTIGTPMIQEIMPKQKFEKIRQYIHFNDNSNLPPRNSANGDRLFKIRPIVETLNRTFSTVPLETYLCVDEQICSTKARCNLKRYNPKKPHKWGYKIFVLSGVSGFAYKIEPETGAENVVLPDEPDLGASSNVVVRMARGIPRHQNYQLYFDNYFTSLALLEYLAKEAAAVNIDGNSLRDAYRRAMNKKKGQVDRRRRKLKNENMRMRCPFWLRFLSQKKTLDSVEMSSDDEETQEDATKVQNPNSGNEINSTDAVCGCFSSH